MIPVEEFIEYIRNGCVPPSAPIVPNWENITRHDDLSSYQARDIVTKFGMWAIVDMQWTQRLAEWIGNRSCLEIMAGAGWLTRALSDHGIHIIATDDQSWGERHANMKHVASIECLSALDAVTKYNANADILIVSWPPYGDDAICHVCKLWGNQRPIIYIGESEGGCNAPDEFFNNFRETESIRIPQWDGLHDYVSIGYYTNR